MEHATRMTVNPTKLRPYDEPPRRRMRLIPSWPGSGATVFLVAAAAWAAVALGLGVLAIGMRLLPGIGLEYDTGLFGITFTFDALRVDHAFVNALVYGFLSNAGFGAAIFMAPRLTGRPMMREALLNLALVIWNGALATGVAVLYFIEVVPHTPLTSLPWWIDGGLATGIFIVTALVVLSTLPRLATAYISAWFSILALLAFLGLISANALLGMVELIWDVPDLVTALASIYLARSIETMWLLGITYASLHYVVPRATGGALYSWGLGILTLLTWLMLAPLSGLGLLIDSSVPYWITTVGSVATMLLVVPAALAIGNLLLSMRGGWSVLFGATSGAFASVSLAFLLATVMLQAIGGLRTVRGVLGGTEWEAGVFVLAAVGCYGFAAYAMAEHALPRALRRAWGGGPLSAVTLWSAFGGATIAGLALMGAGLAQGTLMATAAAPELIDAALWPYRGAALLGMGLAALSGLALLVNLFLLYTMGEPAEYVVPAGTPSATAPAAGR
jgi:cytochrome c oxidase cbb3-type subunit I